MAVAFQWGLSSGKQKLMFTVSFWLIPVYLWLQEAFKTEELSVLSFVFSNEQDY